jgi:hypothetical protein
MADNREKRADWLKDVEAVNAWTKRQAWCDPRFFEENVKAK